MKIINQAETSVDEIVAPVVPKGCGNCLDACECIDPEACYTY